MAKKALIRYSKVFKKQVVRAYKAGASADRLREKYGIKGRSDDNAVAERINGILKLEYGLDDAKAHLRSLEKSFVAKIRAIRI